MTSQSPRIYTYKITFEEVPYYYYGSKKERYYNQEYFGSPKTNKWCWELYTPKKQILELFDYTDEGYEECRKVEDRLIKPVINDSWCLNERYGGVYSLQSKRKSGKKGGEKTKENKSGIFTLTKKQLIECGNKTKELGVGIFAMTKEEKKEVSSKVGKKLKELGLGIHGRTKEQMSEDGKKGGRISGRKSYELKIGMHGMSEEEKLKNCILGGKNAAKKCKQNKTGIFSLTPEQLSENGKKVNLQKWMCLETGYISTPAGLSNYQRARNIDTSNRIKIS
jgi:hypothetical protein